MDYRFHRQHLKAAKELVNPVDADPLDVEIVKKTLLALKNGEFGWGENRPITSLYAVTWGNPPYYQQMIDKIKDMPPPYEVSRYDSWVMQFGRKAKELGFWDGNYLGYQHPFERSFRITESQLSVAMGD